MQEYMSDPNHSLGIQTPHQSRSGVSYMSNESRGSRDAVEGQELANRSLTGGSTERSQLSPSLMHMIPQVKQDSLKTATTQARELSGWGGGIPNAAQVK